MGIIADISGCRLCADRFARTATAHRPRPVVWFDPSAPPRILVAGQAPGLRVHDSGRPFTDPSGDRLRLWLGLDEATFYDKTRIAIVPMAFCFPGYDAKGSDLPPPPVCARTWHDAVLAALGPPQVTVLLGGHAMKRYICRSAKVAETVADWRSHAPSVFPLPHPSWRNTAWIKARPWFETDVLPTLRRAVKEALK